MFGSRVCMGESARILALQALQVYLCACSATSCLISPSEAAVPTDGKAGMAGKAELPRSPIMAARRRRRRRSTMPLTSRSAIRHGQICASSLLLPSMWTCLCFLGQRKLTNWSRISGALLTSPVVFCRMPLWRSRRPSWHWSKMTLSTSGCAST